MKYLIVLPLLIGSGFRSYSQHTFSFGVRNGMGVTPSHMNATLNSPSDNLEVKPNANYCKGVVVQYLIGNLIGIESGIQMINYRYTAKNENYSLKFFVQSSKYEIEVYDYQIPIIFILKRDHPSNPYKHFKFIAGTTFVDWLTNEWLTEPKSQPWLKNIILGIRIGSDKIKFGRIEYGFEYQYSLSRFNFQALRYGILQDTFLNARLSTLTFNIYFFIFSKTLSKHAPEIDS